MQGTEDTAAATDLCDDDAKALRESAERFAAIANLSPDVISIIGADGRLHFNSSAALRIHGYTNDEIAGRNTLEFIHPDDRDHIAAAIHEITQRPGGHASVQYRYRHKAGHYTWMEAHGYNQFDNPAVGGIITISRDISDRKQAEIDLRAALAVRDEFLSIASHEFKTPLTFLKAQLQLLESKFGGHDERAVDRASLAKALQASSRQVDRLVHLVADLLEGSSNGAGTLRLALAAVELSAAVSECVEHFQRQLGASAGKFTAELEPGIRGVLDMERINQVLENLIGNALKYAPHSPIFISLVNRGSTVILKVRDEGPGIPPEYLPIIFEPYERAGATPERSGLGLGLFIAKRIVDAHQGRIWVESEPGKGTTFGVELPLDLSRDATMPLRWAR